MQLAILFYFSLGYWQENIFKYMMKYLSVSPVDIQIDLLKTIISGKNVHYIERVSEFLSLNFIDFRLPYKNRFLCTQYIITDIYVS